MASKILIIDIGNTTTQFAVFEDEKILSSLTVLTKEKELKKSFSKVNDFASKFLDVKDGMIFSVVPKANKIVKNFVKKAFGFLIDIFDWENYDLKNKNSAIKDKIGADILGDIFAAVNYYGGPALVADLGTVNKLLLIDKNNSFEGSSFTPGMEGSLRYFYQNTALLPELNKVNSMNKELAINTIDSMNHGVYWSTVGYIKESYKNLVNPKIKLILTGGNAQFIKDDIKDAIFDSELTLKGMNILFKELRKWNIDKPLTI